jgi:colanic acid biosynthesis glycosyl transferase WcaI
MRSKRVLLLSPFFYPEMISTGRYNSFLAKALVKNGYDVDVICFHPLYPDWRPRISNAVIAGIRAIRGGAWIRFPANPFLRRALLEAAFTLHILRRIGRIRRYAHVITVLPPMLFLPVVLMAINDRTTVTAIVHDLQGVMAGIGKKPERSGLINLIRIVERAVLQRSHRIVVLSKTMARFLTRRYGIPAARLTIFPPFITVQPPRTMAHLGHVFANDKKHVVYAGALGAKQNPEKLVRFFHHLANYRPGLVCHLFSGGPLFEGLHRKWSGVSDRLLFHPLVPDHELFELYSRSDIHVLPLIAGFSQGAMPSKLPNLLAAGVPLLYLGRENTDIGRLISETGAGLCAGSWNLDRLTELVDRLLEQSAVSSHEDRQNDFNRKYAHQFNVDFLIKKLVTEKEVS